MKTLYLASSNKGKQKEIQKILSPLHFEICILKNYKAPEETGKNFEENAKIKALHLKKSKPKSWVLAEDSGLEVEALNHQPGIYSARWAGPEATDKENNLKLLNHLKNQSLRRAQFHSCLVLLDPLNQEFVFKGQVQGQITNELRGSQGFGYDFCFAPEGEAQTFAELGLDYKNKVSHRAKALQKLLIFLESTKGSF